MITHVVLFQMKEPKPQNVAEVAAALRAMDGRVAGLGTITVGIDINRGPRASDLCLITTHEDAEALAAYQADAIHGEVKRMIGERTTDATVVDFDV
jgi:hypothetical protein